jgi:hypothetical protein
MNPIMIYTSFGLNKKKLVAPSGTRTDVSTEDNNAYCCSYHRHNDWNTVVSYPIFYLFKHFLLFHHLEHNRTNDDKRDNSRLNIGQRYASDNNVSIPKRGTPWENCDCILYRTCEYSSAVDYPAYIYGFEALSVVE